MTESAIGSRGVTTESKRKNAKKDRVIDTSDPGDLSAPWAWDVR